MTKLCKTFHFFCENLQSLQNFAKFHNALHSFTQTLQHSTQLYNTLHNLTKLGHNSNTLLNTLQSSAQLSQILYNIGHNFTQQKHTTIYKSSQNFTRLFFYTTLQQLSTTSQNVYKTTNNFAKLYKTLHKICTCLNIFTNSSSQILHSSTKKQSSRKLYKNSTHLCKVYTFQEFVQKSTKMHTSLRTLQHFTNRCATLHKSTELYTIIRNYITTFDKSLQNFTTLYNTLQVLSKLYI